MTREELIEKVAECIAEFYLSDTKQASIYHDVSEEISDTIFYALKHPTKDMRKVGSEARWATPVRNADCVTEIWQAMLNASPLAKEG